MKLIRSFLLSVLLLQGFLQLNAGEYVPPPTGPYQSSVVINQNQDKNDTSNQVYKFPSDSLIQAAEPVSPTYFNVNSNDLQPELRPQVTQNTAIKPPKAEKQSGSPIISQPSVPQAVITHQAQPVDSNFARNPWAADTYTYPNNYSYPNTYMYPDSYQRNWNNQQFSIPQQYSNGYNNQNNFMNGPFNGMPTPWSEMPMQPFFLGR